MENQALQKVAADANLGSEQLRNIAAFAFATSLASPAVGMNKDQVKSATDAFIGGLDKNRVRHEKLVDMIRDHVKAPAGA